MAEDENALIEAIGASKQKLLEKVDAHFAGRPFALRLARLWCAELPGRLLETALRSKATPELQKALLAVQPSEATDLLEATSLVCLAALVVLSTSPDESRAGAGERFVVHALPIYSKPMPEPVRLAGLLRVTKGQLWFGGPVGWLNCLARTVTAQRLLASRLDYAFREGDPALMTLNLLIMSEISGLAKSSIVDGDMLAEYDKSNEAAVRNVYITGKESPREFLNIALVAKWRAYAARNNSVPSARTSDADLIALFEKVMRAFLAAAEARGEELQPGQLNRIALYFFAMNEDPDLRGFIDLHLHYESQQYRKNGLRKDYQETLLL